MKFFILILSSVFASTALAEETFQSGRDTTGITVNCWVKGSDGSAMTPIVQFTKTFLLAEIEAQRTATEKAQTEACNPRSQYSELHGDANSMQLNASAWICGNHKPYYTMELFYNKVPFSIHLNDVKGRLTGSILLNDEATARGLPPIKLPEGEFSYVMARCKEVSAEEAKELSLKDLKN